MDFFEDLTVFIGESVVQCFFYLFELLPSYPLLFAFVLIPVACLAVSLIKRLIN